MTPEYHYAVAESILAQADGNDDLTLTEAGVLFARAQVHATLAGAGLDRAENEKLKREVARLERVIDERARDWNASVEFQDKIDKAIKDAGVKVDYLSGDDIIVTIVEANDGS